jgi:hypothetical protein
MKKNNCLVFSLTVVTGVVLFLNACSHSQTTGDASAGGAYSSVHLPQDALPTCTVPLDSFNAWFSGGKAVENGFVNPANSVTFGHNDNCDFYEWSERMFLWITSQNQGQYGSQGTVMESPVFYTVSPDSDKMRQLIRHEPGQLIRATGELLKNGPNRLPLFKDKTGQLFEVVLHKPGEKVLVKNQLGAVVEIGSVIKGANGAAIFKDKSGKTIQAPMLPANLLSRAHVLQEFPTPTGPVLVDANGKQVDTEVGQATGNVLMARSGSLVYYITMVNDMYAYFLTAVDTPYRYMPGNQFPISGPARDSIFFFARTHGFPIPPDPNALTIEIKTSWVIADSLTDQSKYVTMDAIVPDYDISSNTNWIPQREKKVKLALTAIHIVGAVAKHPEMIWATFEHESNTPNAAYQYIDTGKKVQTVAADTGTRWVFNNNATAPASTFNIPHMSAVGDTIVADSGQVISPSNTLRVFPMGTEMYTVPNQQDTSASASNTEIISINNNIRGMIPGNDVRKNYLFIGATWTFGGTPPNGSIYPQDSTTGGAIGTSLLANSTMETYFQTPGHTCFTCHQTLAPTRLSHVFAAIQPLRSMMKAVKNKEVKAHY